MIRGGLGLDPWDVLHDALSRRTGLTFGTITAIVGALVLLCWIPLRQRPGVGTVANIVRDRGRRRRHARAARPGARAGRGGSC